MEAIMTMETAINKNHNWDQDKHFASKMDEQGIESNPRHEGKLQSPQGDKRKEPGAIKLNIMYFLWFKHLNSKT